MFFDATSRTVTTVRLIVSGDSDYPNVDDTAGVARRISARGTPPNRASQSLRAQSPDGTAELFGWFE